MKEIRVWSSNVGEEELKQVADSFSHQWMAAGTKVKEFEQRMSERLGQEMVLVDSGSNALFMAVHLLNLPPNSEVILPSLTWIACANAVVLAGHRPVFCDVDLETQNVTSDLIKEKITPKTGAIIIVHYAGKPIDMQPIQDLGFPTIEDIAHAVDSSYNQKTCGTMGDIGVFSFDEIKQVSTPQGGGITSKNPSIIQRAKGLRYCGISSSSTEASKTKRERWWERDVHEPFIKMRPTDISAGIGLAQLNKLPKHQMRRKEIWEAYQKAFSNVPEIITPKDPEEHEKYSYFSYLIRVEKRDELAASLLRKNIFTTLNYYPLHFNNIYGSTERLPNTEEINRTGLNIPLHPLLTDEDVSRIVHEIISFCRGTHQS